MFHWICPECGHEIAPQVLECATCDPAGAPAPALPEPAPAVVAEVAPAVVPPVVTAVVASVVTSVIPPVIPMVEPAPIRFELAPEPLLLAAPASQPEPSPEIATEPEPPPVQPKVSGAPRPPASARPQPVQVAGREIAPLDGVLTMLARTVARTPQLPALEPAAAPRVAHAPLRAPESARPASFPPEVQTAAAGPEPSALAATLLEPVPPPAPQPPFAQLQHQPGYALAQGLARMKLAPQTSTRTLSPPHEQLSLPGPTLPHELTSLSAAGIARIMVAGAGQMAPRQSSWFLSLVVASVIVAGSLAAVFYAIPTLAGPAPAATPVAKVQATPVPALPVIPDNPLARRIEVTGIRFVTDLPNQRPEIHYLVVNHSNDVLSDVTVSVTLRALESGADGPPISRFSFRTPRLKAYESKEMASSIERINRPVDLPDWRRVRADVEVAQQ